jgi:hypothetical protein
MRSAVDVRRVQVAWRVSAGRNVRRRRGVQQIVPRAPIALLGALCVAVAVLAVVPRAVAGNDAGSWYRGSSESSAALGRAVAREGGEVGDDTFHTGSSRFDAEWRFGSAVMAALGFGQTAFAHPELRDWALEEMDRALDRALSERGRRFDRDAWHEDALDAIDKPNGHAAFFGYLNLALSLRRFVAGESRFSAENDRFTQALATRFDASPLAIVETYPGERYPVDNTAGIASVALHDRALGQAPRPLVERCLSTFRARYVDRQTGLLVQAVDAQGAPADRPRGSGTALAVYFVSFTDAALSGELYAALRSELAGDVLGFGVIREYPRGSGGWHGDIDSGPLVFGWSISAMGFALAGTRIHRDPRAFTELYRAMDLFGAPYARRGEAHFVAAGPLGNAILFAMLTALPAERWGAR